MQEVKVRIIPKTKNECEKMKGCSKCRKPTRSHIVEDRAICHVCWLKMSKEEQERFEAAGRM
jgi:hypothetical protein